MVKLLDKFWHVAVITLSFRWFWQSIRAPGGGPFPGAVVACLALPGVLRTGLFGSRVEIRTEFLLNGIFGSGGFRRVRSCVRIRKLLTRASGAPGVEIGAGSFLRGIWGFGGFRRVRSGVRIRNLLIRASGTLLASRLGRNKIWEFGR